MLGLAIGATPASAAWTAPANLSAAGQDATDGQVASNVDGDLIFTWERSDGTNTRIQARARSAGGVLGTLRNISPAGQDAFDPQVAIEADGDALLVWDNGANGRIQIRARSAGGVLGAVQGLSPAGADAGKPQIAVDADGDAVVTWENPATGRIHARARSAGGVLGAVQTISSASQTGLDPRVAVDAGGDAVFTWLDLSTFQIQARARAAGGALGSIMTLSAPGQLAGRPQLAVEAGGDAIFTWQRRDGSATDCCYRVQARTLSAAGVLGATRTLSRTGGDASNPSVGVDVDGASVFTWQRHDGSNFRAQARALSATGVLSSPQNLSPAGQTVFLDPPQLAVEPDGDAVLTWLNFTIGRIQARTRSATGALGPVQSLSAAGQFAEQHRVAVAGNGAAAVIWKGSDGLNTRIQAAFGP